MSEWMWIAPGAVIAALLVFLAILIIPWERWWL